MKKLILLIAVIMMAVSTGLSLEPTRVSVYAPQFRTVAEGGSGPATNVRVDLVDYNGGATTLYTGKVFSAPDAEVTADDNGVILVTVGGSTDVHPTLGPSTFADVWGDIDAGNMNTFWTFDIYINGTLYSQGRIDQQVIIQANTSIFNTSGVLLPSGNPSTVGDDNNRFDAVYVKENEADADLEGVYIGPSGGVGTNQLALTYDNTAGEGIISSNGADIMNFDATGVDLNGTIVDNVAEINAGNQALAISGAFTANQPANTIGDGNEGLQLTISGSPTTQPVSLPNYELVVDGDAKMEYLEVSGFSLTGDFNMNGNTLYDVREVVGATGNGGALLLNATSSVSPVWTANGPITTGTGQFTINGNLDATDGVDVTGDNLTVNNGSADIFIVDVTNDEILMGDNSGVDIFLGSGSTDNVFVNGEVQTNIVPGSASLTLGTDADRWLGAYFLGNSVHIGDANGDDSAELEIGWGSDIATFAVNGTTPQFSIDATTGSELISFDADGDGTPEASINSTNQQFLVNSDDGGANELVVDGNNNLIGLNPNGSGPDELRIDAATQQLTVNPDDAGSSELIVNANTDLTTIDPAGDGVNYSFAETGLTIDNGGTSVVLSDGALTSSAPQEFEMIATGGNLDVLIDGKIDVESPGSSIGNGANVQQLFVGGVVGGVYEVVNEGDLDVSGNINVEGNLRNDQANPVLVDDAQGLRIINGPLNATFTGNSIGDNTDNTQLTIDGLVGSNNVLVVEGNTDIDGTLNADGNTTLQEDVDLGSATDDAISFLGRVDTNVEPIADDTYSIGSDALRWADVYVNGGSVHIGDANGAGAGAAELNIGWTSNQATFNVDNAANAQFNIDAGNSNLEIDPAGDGTSTNFIFAEGSATVNTAGGIDLVVTEGGVNRNDGTADQTFAFANTGAGFDLNVTMDGDLNVDGNTTLNGNVDLGDAADDDINAAGEFISNLTPNANNTYDLGSNTLSQRWRNLWLSNNANVGNTLTVDGPTVLGSDNADNIRTNGEFVTSLIRDEVTPNVDLGSSTKDWRDLWLSNDANIGNNAEITNDANVGNDLDVVGATTLNGTVALGDAAADEITVAGEFVSSLIPTAASTIDLGATGGQEWQDLHLSNNAEIGNDANIANNAVVDGEVRYNDADQSNYVGFTSPAVVGTNQIWTLPAADGNANEALMTDGSGTLSWGGLDLQTAYDNGQSINMVLNGTNADIVITGNNDLDLQVPLVNNAGGSAVEVDDALDVTGNITLDPGAGAVFTVNTSGNGVLQGNLDVEQGLDISGGNLTMSDNSPATTFSVAQSGNTLIEGTLTVNGATDLTAGLDVTGGNLTVGGAANFVVNNTNGQTEIGGSLGLNTATAAGSGANVFVINNFGASTFSIGANMGTHPDGSVVYVRFTGTTPSDVTDQTGSVGAIDGFVAVNDGGLWYVVARY